MWKNIKNNLKQILKKKVSSFYHHSLSSKFDEIMQDYKNIEYGAALNPVDAFFAYRLLLGRNPNLVNELPYLLSNNTLTFREFLNNLIESEEFSNNPGFLPPNKTLMAEIEGFRFWFNSSDREMGVRMALGWYEPASVEFIKGMIKPGMVCIDAGANTGFYTCLMAARGAFVYAFEPMPKNYDLLIKNIAENSYQQNVQTYQMACSDVKKSISGSMVSNMYIATDVDTGDKITMEAVAVDDIVKSPVNLIKIDIEGHEPQAIQGMRQIISDDKPIIISEINEYWLRKCSGLGGNEYVQILTDFGYEVFNVSDLKNPLKPKAFNLDILDTMDIVAFHKERSY
ncbi:MAG: FkbM family methyltransferase [Heteroscytonema crispum UTEX LB 1556]